MKSPDVFDENGIPVFTAENTFGKGGKVHVQLASEFPEYVGKLHKHEFIEIVYIVSGSATHRSAGGEYKVSAGDVVVINYHTPHAFYEDDGGEKFLAYDLMFTPDFLDPSLLSTAGFDDVCASFLFYSLFPEKTAVGSDLHLSGAGYGIFSELFNKIYSEYRSRQKGYIEIVRAYTVELIIKMFRQMENHSARLSPRQKETVERAVSYLRESFQSHVTLEELAMQVFLSKDYLNKIFHKATGLPVNAFLQKLRIEEAARLLLTTDMPVEAVARECGYGDVKAFYSSFKKIMKTTPGAYKRGNTADKPANGALPSE